MNMATYPYVSVSRSDMAQFKQTLNIPVVLDRLDTIIPVLAARGTNDENRHEMGADGECRPLHYRYTLVQGLMRPCWYTDQAAFEGLYFIAKVIRLRVVPASKLQLPKCSQTRRNRRSTLRLTLLSCYAVPGANARANGRGSSMVGGMGRRPARHAVQPPEAAGDGVHTAGGRPSGASSAQAGSCSRRRILHPVALSGHGGPGEAAWPVAPAPSRCQCSQSQGVCPGGWTSNLAAAGTASDTGAASAADASAATAAPCPPALAPGAIYRGVYCPPRYTSADIAATCAPAYATCAPASAASAASAA